MAAKNDKKDKKKKKKKTNFKLGDKNSKSVSIANKFKRKKKKKTPQELEAERKKRELERAKKDMERAKQRLSLRTRILDRKKIKQKKPPATPGSQAKDDKEKRKKVLRYKRAQSRFALPKINFDDDLSDIVAANNALNNADNSGFPDVDNIQNNDNTTTDATVHVVVTNADPTVKINNSPNNNDNNDNDDDKKMDDNDNDNDNDDNQSVVSAVSAASVVELTVSSEQEEALNQLMSDLEKADPDYYGFVDWGEFIKILKANDINLDARHETYLMGALTLIDEGVDYYDFARQIREVGRELQPDNTLQDICEEIAENREAEQKKINDAKALQKKQQPTLPYALDPNAPPDTSLTKNISVDQDEFEAFYAKTQQYRGRGMSLARMKSASQDVQKSTKLGELIDDLALDGAEIDFALLKTALATIDCHPSDRDLKYIIKHLDTDNTGFVDFNYLITFLQQTSHIPANKWTNIAKIISIVVDRLKMVERAEERKRKQQAKLKARLAKRKSKNTNTHAKELAQLDAAEKRMRALKLKEKAKQYK